MHITTTPLQAPKVAQASLHHLFITDVSGSMSGELQRMREQLKDQLAKLLKPEDRLSILAFSGRDEVFVVAQNESVHDLQSFRKVEQAIDRQLRPVGLTGFKDPLHKAAELAKASALDTVATFLTDGMDNQSSHAGIIAAAKELGEHCSAVQVVEYGNYCDRQLLAEIAASSGGSLNFSERWEALSEAIAGALRDAPRGRRVEVELPGDAEHCPAVAWTVEGDAVVQHLPQCAGGKVTVRVQEGAGEVFAAYDALPTNLGGSREAPREAGYALISMGAQRRDGDLMEAGLRLTGDVALINQYASAFGPQPLADLAEAARLALIDPAERLKEGYDPEKVPAEDAFTVLDLLETLRQGDNRFLPDHPEFRYNRTGRVSVERGDDFGENELKILEKRAEKAKAEGQDAVDKLTAEIQVAMLTKEAKPRFDLDDAPDGYPISRLTGHAARANVSTLLQKPGTLTLTGKLPEGFNAPKSYRTQIWRNMSVLVDGRYNVDVLPLKLDEATDAALRPHGVLPAEKGQVQLVNIRALPIVNRKMVRGVTATSLAQIEVEQIELRAHLKVYNHAWDINFPAETSEGLAQKYGQDAADFLRKIGLTDSGYSPRSDLAEATDQYMGTEVKVSVKGYSTLPKVDDVINGMRSGKLNGPGQLMAKAQDELEAKLAEISGMDAKAQGEVLRGWLRDRIDRAETRLAELREQGARLRFAVLVGRVALPDLDASGSVKVQRGGTEYTVKIEIVEKAHKI